MKKKLATAITLMTVTGLITLSWVFERFPAGVASDLTSPDFASTCQINDSQRPIDANGELTVGVWNIYKQQKVGWKTELAKLIDTSQLVLLQEASLTTALKAFLAQHSDYTAMARAFTGFNIANGVMDIARVPASHVCAQLTSEPLIQLPKSTLVATYPLSNGQSLLVVNLHGVNFSWGLETYTEQLQAATSAIMAHSGPVIVAGDFNTWREKRLALVDQMMAQFELTQVSYHRDDRSEVFGYPLDHLYYRGLSFESAQAWPTTASDHNPIQARFHIR